MRGLFSAFDEAFTSTGATRAAARLAEHRAAQAERLRDAPAQPESRQVRRALERAAAKLEDRSARLLAKKEARKRLLSRQDAKLQGRTA